MRRGIQIHLPPRLEGVMSTTKHVTKVTSGLDKVQSRVKKATEVTCRTRRILFTCLINNLPKMASDIIARSQNADQMADQQTESSSNSVTSTVKPRAVADRHDMSSPSHLNIT